MNICEIRDLVKLAVSVAPFEFYWLLHCDVLNLADIIKHDFSSVLPLATLSKPRTKAVLCNTIRGERREGSAVSPPLFYGMHFRSSAVVERIIKSKKRMGKGGRRVMAQCLSDKMALTVT